MAFADGLFQICYIGKSVFSSSVSDNPDGVFATGVYFVVLDLN